MMILVYLGRWSYGRFKDDNNIFYKMKNDLTTGTWQDDIWCPINIILLCTSDEGHKQRGHSFVKMLLANFATITNLYPVIHYEIANNQQALACALACCTLVLTGSDILNPSIIQRIWEANNTIWKTLGEPRGDLALIQWRLVLLSKIAINTYHLWETTNFNNARIINNDALRCHPPSLLIIIQSLQDPTTTEYVCVPLALGTAPIHILLLNLWHNMIDPSSITYEDAAVSWYSDLHLHGCSATDTTGIKNRIFQTFDITSPTHYST
jgi:hypothetical protein